MAMRQGRAFEAGVNFSQVLGRVGETLFSSRIVACGSSG